MSRWGRLPTGLLQALDRKTGGLFTIVRGASNTKEARSSCLEDLARSQAAPVAESPGPLLAFLTPKIW